MQSIQSRGLTAGSLYKVLCVGLLIPLFILGVAFGIASYFGASVVAQQGVYVYGLKGLVTGMIFGIILPIILSAVLWVVIGVGIFLWTRVKTLTLNIKE